VGTPCASGCTIPMQVSTEDPIQGAMATIIEQDVAPTGITIQIDSVDNAVQAANQGDYNFQLTLARSHLMCRIRFPGWISQPLFRRY